MKRLLTVRETAEYLGISEKTLYKWVNQRKIPYVKLSHKLLRFDTEQIEKFIDENTQHPVNIDSFPVMPYNMMPHKPKKRR